MKQPARQEISTQVAGSERRLARSGQLLMDESRERRLLVRRRFGALALAWVLSLSAAPGHAEPLLRGESAGMAYQVEEIASGLGVPWGLAMLDDGSLLLTEREGKVRRLDPDSGQLTRISGLPPVRVRGQGGLLDVAVAPDYRAGQWIYFTYVRAHSSSDQRGVTTLARARLQGDRLQQWQDLLVTDSATGTDRHFGSRIQFDGRGHLFFGVGDRGERPNGQNPGNHAGALLRLNLDGRVPADNPFVGQAGVKPEIWSYGHRNPQGLAWDAEQGRLWEIEHGPRGGDELNLIVPGANYGWATLSYGKEYWGPIAVGEGTERAGMVAPSKVYIPSIAPGSLLLYRGDAFPAWRGNLFAGALALTHLNRIVLDGETAVDEERLLGALNERIRALAQSPQGWLYLSTDSGRILRIRPQ